MTKSAEPAIIYVGPDESGKTVVRVAHRNGILLGEAKWLVEFIVGAVLDETAMKHPVPEWAKIAAQAFPSTR
ncbi:MULTISPECIES: hypothetical protein [Brucella]|uniref:hypothetical protein n=1 Tax=Brucella TaxID=234 RepID=UPI001296535B|nr:MULTISPECIES: hypothetical protein [Brucella]QGA55870.1 hypothetical protein GHC20_01705 [Brucella sp. 2280]WGG58254.1 hypothetical protein QA414_07740 [Brucella intermedia]